MFQLFDYNVSQAKNSTLLHVFWPQCYTLITNNTTKLGQSTPVIIIIITSSHEIHTMSLLSQAVSLSQLTRHITVRSYCRCI